MVSKSVSCDSVLCLKSIFQSSGEVISGHWWSRTCDSAGWNEYSWYEDHYPLVRCSKVETDRRFRDVNCLDLQRNFVLWVIFCQTLWCNIRRKIIFELAAVNIWDFAIRDTFNPEKYGSELTGLEDRCVPEPGLDIAVEIKKKQIRPIDKNLQSFAPEIKYEISSPT